MEYAGLGRQNQELRQRSIHHISRCQPFADDRLLSDNTDQDLKIMQAQRWQSVSCIGYNGWVLTMMSV